MEEWLDGFLNILILISFKLIVYRVVFVIYNGQVFNQIYSTKLIKALFFIEIEHSIFIKLDFIMTKLMLRDGSTQKLAIMVTYFSNLSTVSKYKC